MSNVWNEYVLKVCSATVATRAEVIQSLWSGYGEIVRVELMGAEVESIVLKQIDLSQQNEHPRGWNTNLSHQRKVKSYEVEAHWYQQFSGSCDNDCKVPHCYGVLEGEQSLIVLEDLDESGFPLRKSSLDLATVKLCLNWLANFHATFLHQQPAGIWPIGSYWHLETRPDEFDVMQDSPLKQAAGEIDRLLNQCRYQTFVHGDAKVANFCFSLDGESVAAVDFQYVGGGCGMKDVAYLLGSCLYEDELVIWESALLDSYFNFLERALLKRHKHQQWTDLEKEWRYLYPIAWADFHRFLMGWMPSHDKVNDYSDTMVTRALQLIIR